MFQGHYLRWNPIAQLESKRMTCEVVHDDGEGLRIWLAPEKPAPMLQVRFEAALLYAKSDEGSRLSKVQNATALDFPHVFWKVENSALLTEFHRQSCGTCDFPGITHYAFLSSSGCVDVLSVGEPSFEGHDGV